MNRAELKTVVRSLGWTLRERKMGNKYYMYAHKTQNGKGIGRYLFTSASLKDRQPSDVWDRILGDAPRSKVERDPKLIQCPFCKQMHPSEFIKYCPLKP